MKERKNCREIETMCIEIDFAGFLQHWPVESVHGYLTLNR